jgi:hypothetical protein
MTHLLTGADRAAHCKIVTLGAIFALAVVCLTSRVVETNAAAVRAQASAPALALAVGKLGLVAAFEPTTVR